MSTPNKRGPAKGQGGRPKGSTKAVARTERLNDRLLPGTVLGLRRRAGDIPLFAYLANLAKPVCPKCGTSINMVLHCDEWVCHSTHRSPATITRL